MRTSYLLCALLLAACLSCERMEPDIKVRRSRVLPHHERGGRAADSTGGELSAARPGHGLFVTAIEYPSGYDWRRDTARGDIRGRLLLLHLSWDAAPAPFDTILALEAGKGRAVSLDPDRHHFTGGHLYTECITELGTVYRCDGRTVHISREREYVRGILSSGEELYVLSTRLDGGGFILRHNWKPILVRNAGRIHGSTGDPAFGRSGALFLDRGQACFFYEAEEGRWLLVRDGEEETVPLPDALTHLYDIHFSSGNLCLVGRWKQREPVLFIGSKRHDLSTTLQIQAQKYGFCLIRNPAPGDGIRFSGSFRITWNQLPYTGLWSERRLLVTREGRCDWIDGTAYLCRENGRVTEAGVDGERFTLDGSGTMMMPACAFRTGKELFLALTTGGGDSGADGPQLWINGISIPLILNGFLTSVTKID